MIPINQPWIGSCSMNQALSVHVTGSAFFPVQAENSMKILIQLSGFSRGNYSSINCFRSHWITIRNRLIGNDFCQRLIVNRRAILARDEKNINLASFNSCFTLLQLIANGNAKMIVHVNFLLLLPANWLLGERMKLRRNPASKWCRVRAREVTHRKYQIASLSPFIGANSAIELKQVKTKLCLLLAKKSQNYREREKVSRNGN